MSSYVPPSIATSTNAVEASTFASETVGDIKKDLSEGSLSLRVVSIVDALVMIVMGVLGFLTNFITWHFVAAFFKIYVFVIGVIVLVLETGKRLSLFSGLDSKISSKAPFLNRVSGRGCFYILAGLSLCFLGFLVEFVLGALLAFVGISYILLGHRTASKLAAKRGSEPFEQLQEMFAMADVDGKGSLTLDQFRQFTASLGLDLNKQESEVAFLEIDHSRTGRITYESVHMWWTQEAAAAAAVSAAS